MRKSKAVLASAMSLWLMAFTCNAQSWFALVNTLLPLASQIALQFFTYSNRGTLSASDAANIQRFSNGTRTIFKDIGADVTAWQTTKDPSKIAHINALLAQIKVQAADLLNILQVKDPNTLAFVTAIVQDAVDLAGLVPIVTQSPLAKQGGGPSYNVKMQVSLPKAKSLEDMFKTRLANLPK